MPTTTPSSVTDLDSPSPAALDAGGDAAQPRARRLVARWAPVVALLTAAGLLVVIPLLVLLRTALEEGLDAFVVAVTSASPAVWATLWTSLSAMFLALFIGATIAVLTERTDVPGRRGLRLAMLLALVVPGYVAALGWLNTYGPGGLPTTSSVWPRQPWWVRSASCR